MTDSHLFHFVLMHTSYHFSHVVSCLTVGTIWVWHFQFLHIPLYFARTPLCHHAYIIHLYNSTSAGDPSTVPI